MEGLNDVRIIGIWGMGGIGKTTLARAVYEIIRKDFDISCFLPNIREISEKHGLIQLQKKLLSHVNYKRSMEIDDCYEGRKLIKSMLHNKKVLIVLDDVSDRSQLENLAGKQEWFGPGSRVIITTRDARLLTLHGVFAKFDVKILSEDESFRLFCQNAFKGGQPTKHYSELSRRVVKYAEGLPLALKVLGSFFYGRTECEWNDGLDKLSKIPSIDIMKILKVSYDGLDDAEKNLFLDIACFFKGMPKDWGILILKSCGFNPTIEIKHLIEKSMLVDDGIVLEMHDLLQEMGKSIVLQESPNDASKRSRLWTLEDINYVLKKNKGSEVIQSMVLNLSQPYIAHWDPDAFSNIWNLRLLIIRNVNLYFGIKCFPAALKVLEWEGCTLDALPQGVQPDELVHFNMKCSKIKQLWKGTQFLGRLKFIDLSYSTYLIKTPNFDEIPNLERLVLEGCTSLVEVHHSLGQCKKLILINLKGCISLKTLPGKLETDCLETFILSGCLKVRKLPDFGENMKCLSELNLEETDIVKLPESLAYLTNLAILNLRNCKKLLCLPYVLQNLKHIKSINISGCSKFERFPDNLDENNAIEELDVSETAIKEVPSLSGLSLLMKLNLSYCNINDGSLLQGISGLSLLVSLDLSGNNFVNLPVGFISNLLKLEDIDIRNCPRLQSLPKLPPNVLTTDAIGCTSMEPLLGTQRPRDLFASLDLQQGSEAIIGPSLDMSKVKEQKSHSKVKMPQPKFPDTFSSTSEEHHLYPPKSRLNEPRYLCWEKKPLKSLGSTFSAEILVELDMQHIKTRKLWDGMQNLVNLKYINLSDSQHLMELPNFSKALNLEEAFLSGCSSLRKVHPSILSLHKLEVLVLDWCKSLTSLRNDIHLRSLRYLSLYKCSRLKEFSVTSENMIALNLVKTDINELPSSICCMSKLESLNLSGCRKLKNLPSNLMDSLRSLRWLWLDDCCNIFELLDNISMLSSLDRLTINGIAMGRLVASSKDLSGLKFLLFNKCRRLQCLLELPPSIRALSATDCSSLETVTSVAIECTRFEDCVKLDEYSVKAILAYVMVLINKSLSGLENYNLEYNPVSIMCLESRVPDWFKYWTKHAGSITIDLSSAPLYMDWGLLLCFIFSPSQTKEISRILCTGYLQIVNHQSGDTDDDDDADDNDIRNIFYQTDATNLTSDHIFLSYTDDFCSILRRNIGENKSMENSKILYRINVLVLVLDNDKRKWQKHCEEIKECGVCPTYVLEYQNFVKQMEMKSRASAFGRGVGCSYQNKDDGFKGLIFPPRPTTTWKNRTQGFKDIINL